MTKKSQKEKEEVEAEAEAERWLEQLNEVDGKKDAVSETMVTIMVQTSSIVFGLGAVFGTDFIDEFSSTIGLLFFISLILILGSIFFGFWIYFKKVRFWDSLGSKIHEVYNIWSKARKGEVSVRGGEQSRRGKPGRQDHSKLAVWPHKVAVGISYSRYNATYGSSWLDTYLVRPNS